MLGCAAQETRNGHLQETSEDFSGLYLNYSIVKTTDYSALLCFSAQYMAQYGTNVMRNLISFLDVWLLTSLKPHQLPFSLRPHTWASWSENLGTPRNSNPVAPAHRWKFSDSQPPVTPNTSKRPGQGPFLAPVVITDLLKSPAVLPPCRDLSHVRDLFILLSLCGITSLNLLTKF